MKAVVVARPGPPEVLELREVEDPEPGPDEVRIHVRATALNRADLLQRRGRYPAPAGAPESILGLEFAGVVETRGARARTLEVGERVMGLVGGGAYAERLCVHERLCMRLPASLGWVEAAAIPEAFATAYDALFEILRLEPGESLLVNPGGSGVGTAALQLGRAAGARVIALSRSAGKRARLLDLGAAAAPDPGEPGAAGRIRDGAGVAAVLDMVGAPAWPLYLEVLRERGRIAVVGLLGGGRLDADLARWMSLRLTVSGTLLRSRAVEEKIALSTALARHLEPLLGAGAVAPVVDRVFPLEQAAAAHAYMERNRNFGKIVLEVGGARA